MGLRTPKESHAEPEFHLTDYTKREETPSEDREERLDSFPDIKNDDNETEEEKHTHSQPPRFDNRFEQWHKTRDDPRVSKDYDEVH